MTTNEVTDGGAWEATWEVEFPATNIEEMLLAMVVRDLLHGTSFDVEGEQPDGADIALDYVAGDELDGEAYILLVTVEATGPEDREMVQDITEQLLEQLVDEADELVRDRTQIASAPDHEVSFRPVAEDDERWDLVVADWLAPDGAVVPYGFRPYRTNDGSPWPDDEELDRYGRILTVPFAGQLHLIAIPAPTAGDELSGDILPVIP